MNKLVFRARRAALIGAVFLYSFTVWPEDALSILERHCANCHGGAKIKGGLNVITREALLKGGETGPAVNLEKPEESLLLGTIRHQKEPHMPYKKPELSRAEIASLEEWVKQGVRYARSLVPAPEAGTPGEQGGFSVPDRNHWAFQRVRKPSVPKLNGAGLQNPIDAFIFEKLKAAGRGFSGEVEKRQFIRRVAIDLIGLPPSPAEIQGFLADTSQGAHERLVDRLLASPRYGERWARHWLDLARYAETDGFEHDEVRPHSWRYRDYVIGAFNKDTPYDQFVREQVAGDELWPESPEALIATGFNLLGPDMVDSSDQVQRRHNTLNDITDTSTLVFLGLTMGCARCHDHKFEPILQKDYYSFQAFFTPAAFRREHPVPTREARQKADRAALEFQKNAAVLELAGLERPARERVFLTKVSALSLEAQIAHKTPASQRTAEQANLVLETASKVEMTEKELTGELPDDQQKRRRTLQATIKALPKVPLLPAAMVLQTSKPLEKTFILNRGDYSQPRDEVQPGVPGILGQALKCAGPPRRKDLANWIASPENPLAARVMVNRIWQKHFGKGLVSTPSDFGVHGQPPTHPELLDWLASEFVESGWSVKHMHKLMLLSRTYRQSTESTPEIEDPENKLYGRMNQLRMEGEVIRDSLLSIGGNLNLRMAGPGVLPPIPKELFAGAQGWMATANRAEHGRRSVYIFARRNLRFPFLEVFDAPDSNQSCPVRERSTTAPQSLTLLNADEVVKASKLLADRLRAETGHSEDRARLAYELVLGRFPNARETALSREFLRAASLEEFCRALFNVNEFVYLY